MTKVYLFSAITCIVLFLTISFSVTHYFMKTDSFQEALQTTLSYTDGVNAECADIVKSVDGSYYRITYRYKPTGVDEIYYVTYIEDDMNPDVTKLWVSENDPTKVSQIPTTLVSRVAYLVNKPTYVLLEFGLFMICVMLYFSIVMITYQNMY